MFVFTDGTTLRYHDTRKFGKMYLIEKNELYNIGPLKDLGLEKDYEYQHVLSIENLKNSQSGAVITLPKNITATRIRVTKQVIASESIEVKEVDDKEIVQPLKPIIRKATQADLERLKKNEEKEIDNKIEAGSGIFNGELGKITRNR